MQRRGILFSLLVLVFVIGVSAVSGQTGTPTPSPTPTGEYTVYTVTYGDTLGNIALRYGTTVRLLARINHIINVDLLSIGQQIYIPKGDFLLTLVAEATAQAQATAQARGTIIPTQDMIKATGSPVPTTEGNAIETVVAEEPTETMVPPIEVTPLEGTPLSAETSLPVETLAVEEGTPIGTAIDPIFLTATAPLTTPDDLAVATAEAVGDATLDPLFLTATALFVTPSDLAIATIESPVGETPLVDVTATDIGAQAAPTDVPVPTAAILPTVTETLPPAPTELGIELYTEPSRTTSDAALATALGAGWVKLNVYWRDMEAVPGVIDYTALDSEIAALEAGGLQILLTVSTSPAWARTSQEENGPPDDLSLYSDFLTELSGHYIGRVAAYEVWNEPNLRREWNSTIHTLGAGTYAQMLQSAYASVKAVDSAAQVISAGLAPTGIDDGFNAINDRRFFTELLQAGLPQFADGYGIHPYGYATPPDMRCCDQPEGVATHYGDPSFYFLTMLETYRDLGAQYPSNHPLWVTGFGWGIANAGVEVPRNFAYVSYNTPEEQASFTLDALRLGKEFGGIRVMILSNLNGCTVVTENAELCYLSVNTASFEQRPIFEALRQQAASVTPTG